MSVLGIERSANQWVEKGEQDEAAYKVLGNINGQQIQNLEESVADSGHFIPI